MLVPRAPVRVLRGVWRHPRATRDALEAFRNERLRRLVAHAYRNVPYYGDVFDRHGIRPGDIRSVADLTRLPITSRAALRQLPARAVMDRRVDPARLIATTTSGSSGMPFTIRRTWFEQSLLTLFRLRAYLALGLRAGDRSVDIGVGRAVHPRDSKAIGRALRRLGLFRRERIGGVLPPAEIVERLRRLQPDVVGGYAGVLARIAGAIGSRGDAAIRPRMVLSGAEVLTPPMRRRIVEAFGAPVYDVYGCYEVNLIACECGATGELHTCDDAVIVEVVRDGRPVAPGERGEVVVTGLHAYAMPFIRYRLGDVVTRGFECCPCGRPFSTIRAVQGRMIDFFPLPDGRLMHPYELVAPIVREAAGWAGQYRLVQERVDRIVLEVVPTTSPAPGSVARLIEALGGVVGDAVELELRLADEIRPEANGKFRMCQSRVHSEYDGVEWDRVVAAGAPAGAAGQEPVRPGRGGAA